MEQFTCLVCGQNSSLHVQDPDGKPFAKCTHCNAHNRLFHRDANRIELVTIDVILLDNARRLVTGLPSGIASRRPPGPTT